MSRLISRHLQRLFKNPKYQLIDFSAGNSRRFYARHYNVIPLPKKTLDESEYRGYLACFQEIVEMLTTIAKDLPEEVNLHFKKVLNYSVAGHEQAYGPLVVASYKCFAPPKEQTPKNIRLANMIGWVNEFAGNGFQILDDILDSSETRANKVCWYRHEDIGLKAVNDAILIEESTFQLIKHCLTGHASYLPILELTHEVNFKTALGQTLDTVSFTADPEFFTMKKYEVLAKYKSSYMAFIHSVCMGMHLAGVHNRDLHSQVRAVLVELALYFTIQNDILDCYGEPSKTGKYGTDILSGKRTWLAIQALTHGSSFQRDQFWKNYGKPDVESQKTIYSLYENLGLLEKFLELEEKNYNHIRDMIEGTSALIPKELMYNIVDSFFGKY